VYRRGRRIGGTHLVLGEVLHVHDDLLAELGESRHLILLVALHDDPRGVDGCGLGHPQLGAGALGRLGGLALVGAGDGEDAGRGDAGRNHALSGFAVKCACRWK